MSTRELISNLQVALNNKVKFDAAQTLNTTQKNQAKSNLGLATLASTASVDDLVEGTVNKLFTATLKTKLDGIATGATANSTDATLLNRANHTGTQSASTITGTFDKDQLPSVMNLTGFGDGSLVDGETMLNFNSDRPWAVRQRGTLGTAHLSFENTTSKQIWFSSESVFTSAKIVLNPTSTPSILVDGNVVYHAGNLDITNAAGTLNKDRLPGTLNAITVPSVTVSGSQSIARSIDTSNLTLFGGTFGNGANIELYGSTHATQANNAIYDATTHTFRNAGGSGTPPVYIGANLVYHAGNFNSITVGDNFYINGTGNTVLWYREGGVNRAAAYYDTGGDHYAVNLYNSAGTFVRSFVLTETGTFTWGGNTVWHSGNDGPGSGLNSDLFDDQNSSYYTDITGRLGYTPANRAGDTFTADITIGTQPGPGVLLSSSGAIEITRFAGPYIDFKNSSSDDYDVRLIQSGTNNIDMQTVGGTGVLSVDGSALIKTNALPAAMNAIAYNAIGSIAMMRKTVAGTVDQGGTIAGSSLVFSNADGSYTSSAASGTYECLGRASGSTGAAAVANWRKIA